MISDDTRSRRHLTFNEAAAAHKAMTDAIRIVAHYANNERDAGNDRQADALTRHLARLAKAQGPLCEYAKAFNTSAAPCSSHSVDVAGARVLDDAAKAIA